jgi:uncharacterized coiled-coil protein SlyX
MTMEHEARQTPLTSSETISIYRLMGEHYHQVEGTKYWSWDEGWSTQRLLKELTKAGIKNATKSRLDVIRLQHYGKIEEQRTPNRARSEPAPGSLERDVVALKNVVHELERVRVVQASTIHKLLGRVDRLEKDVAQDVGAFNNLVTNVEHMVKKDAGHALRIDNLERTRNGQTHTIHTTLGRIDKLEAHEDKTLGLINRLVKQVEELQALVTAPSVTAPPRVPNIVDAIENDRFASVQVPTTGPKLVSGG